MRSDDRDLAYLWDMREAAREIVQFVQGMTEAKFEKDKVVRYDPADPGQAEIESAMNLWLIPLILVFMGGIAGCLAITFLGFFGLGVSP